MYVVLYVGKVVLSTVQKTPSPQLSMLNAKTLLILEGGIPGMGTSEEGEGRGVEKGQEGLGRVRKG